MQATNDKQIVLVGANHRTAPVELREKLSLSPDDCRIFLKALTERESINEALVLSTCNRVEVTVVTTAGSTDTVVATILNLLDERGSYGSLKDSVYTYSGEAAVRHLFRVAASLDSMVVGEPQISGQVKKAYSLACEVGTCGKLLNKLLPHALHAAKRVRSETDIGASAVSVSYVAVELGRKIFSTLEGKTVLLIGAGDTGVLSARHLMKAGAARVLIANRTVIKARQLAQRVGGEAVDFNDLISSLTAADFVICSTSADEYIVTAEVIRQSAKMRARQSRVFIDLSVPRNIDPEVGTIAGSFLFDIDDLQAVIQSNIRERVGETERAELIITAEVQRFVRDCETRQFGDMIADLRTNMQQIARTELARRRSRLGALTEAQEEAIERMLISVVNKLAHPVISSLRLSKTLRGSRASNVSAELADFDV